MPLGLLLCTASIRDSFVQFAELKLFTVDRYSSANCIYHYAFQVSVYDKFQKELPFCIPKFPYNTAKDRSKEDTMYQVDPVVKVVMCSRGG